MRKAYAFFGAALAGILLVPAFALAVTFFNSGGLYTDDSGKVGIGTSTPSESLEVVGNVKVSGNISAANFTGTESTGTSDNIDSYSKSASLNGLNGGSGWAGVWVKGGGGVYDIVEKPTYSGARAAHSTPDGGGTGTAYRAIDLGHHILMSAAILQTTSTTSDGFRFAASANSGNTSYGLFFNSGNIVLKSTGGDVNIMSFDANKWYVVELEIDSSNHLCRARAREESGAFSAWSSWVNPWDGSDTNAPDEIFFAPNGSYDAYIDSISIDSVN